jgi:chromosome segregation protein
MQDAASRLKNLAGETEGSDTGKLSGEVIKLEKSGKEVAKKLAARQGLLEKDRASLDEHRLSLRDSTARQHELQGEINRKEGRLESLRALQQAARESGDGMAWLESNGLASAPRLAEQLDVQKGWEAAVETVLGFWLDSVLIEEAASLSKGLDQLAKRNSNGVEVTLLENSGKGVKPLPGSLAEKVSAPDAIIEQLNRVQIADSLEAALKSVSARQGEGSMVTAAGQWFGPGWVRVAGSQSGQAGMLARKQEIKSLETELARLQKEWAKLRDANQAERDTLPAMEQGLKELQSEVNELHRKSAELGSRLNAAKARIEDLSGRQKQIAEESAALQQHPKG